MKIIKLKGQIEVLSGLHIGGGDDTMQIGGVDNSVIRDINSNKPYIPGSSLKGKMRSLLEHYFRLVNIANGNGNPFSSKNIEYIAEEQKKDAVNLLKLFGDSSDSNEFGITRISVGDCPVSEESKDLELFEAKYENVINRKTGKAEHPRQTERVPAGVKFDMDIRVKIIGDDDEDAFKELIETGIELIENDYLGGNGSRGYGRVKFNYKWSE
jgi:CRISPR-associated protein Csm3